MSATVSGNETQQDESILRSFGRYVVERLHPRYSGVHSRPVTRGELGALLERAAPDVIPDFDRDYDTGIRDAAEWLPRVIRLLLDTGVLAPTGDIWSDRWGMTYNVTAKVLVSVAPVADPMQTHPADRLVSQEVLHGSRINAISHRRIDAAGADRVDANALGGDVERGTFGQTNDAAFGRVTGSSPGKSNEPAE